MTTSIVILTGSELRHRFFAKFISNQPGIVVLKTYMESTDNDLTETVSKIVEGNMLRMKHLKIRIQSEIDFFGLFDQYSNDFSNSIIIKRNTINDQIYQKELLELNPNIIVSYGCSIIKQGLMEAFKGRFLNIHLGLSPYYKGGGTNFWPFVNNELEYIGVTFMHINSKLDSGEVIHQIRPRIFESDSIHSIGNRLIKEMAICCVQIIRRFKELPRMNQIEIPNSQIKEYRKNDFTEDSIITAYENMKNGLIETFLENYDAKIKSINIVENEGL